MVISDMLYILQHFNLNFTSFLLLILSSSITIVQHLRLDYCESFEIAWKEMIDKSNEISLRVFKNIIKFLVNIGNHLEV